MQRGEEGYTTIRQRRQRGVNQLTLCGAAVNEHATIVGDTQIRIPHLMVDSFFLIYGIRIRFRSGTTGNEPDMQCGWSVSQLFIPEPEVHSMNTDLSP